MTSLSGQWIGNIYGTNTGNAFLEINDAGDQLSGSLRFNDPTTGVIAYSLDGKNGERIQLKLTPLKAPNGIELKPGTVTAILQQDGSLTGRWETELGTAGTFQFHRNNALQPRELAQKKDVSVPEQVFFHTTSIGAVRLYKPDLQKLFQVMTQDFLQAQPIVTYSDRGVQVTKYADAFLKDELPQPIRALKISIQEPEPSGITKLVNVDLVERAGSQVRTSATNESWTVGKAQTLRSMIEVHENRLVSVYRRYGLTINTIIFLLMLIAAPDITPWTRRAIFVGSIWATLVSLVQIYNRLVPNTMVFTSPPKSWWLAEAWSEIVSWLATVASSLAAAWIFWFFMGK